MEYRRCPSCDHEVFDVSYRKCPFCGAKLPGKSGAVPGKGVIGPSSARRIFTLVAALLVLMGAGLVSYFASGRGGDRTDHSVTASQQEVSACSGNMNRILSVESHYHALHGVYTEDINDLLEIDPSLSTECPECGEPYTLAVLGDSVSVECGIHGKMDKTP